jgi:hypothetical protein
MSTYAPTRPGRRLALPAIRDRLGGPDGNEIVTVTTAAVLIVLLAAEGLTLLDLSGFLSVHMFLGLVLIPPVLLKLGSTGYRMVRYYTHSRPYVEKGPPMLAMRLLAPALAASTLAIFVTGVWLLALGHKSDQMVFLHQLSVIVWVFIFGIHVLVYAPRAFRWLVRGWGPSRSHEVPGAGLRGMLVAASLGAGLALALSLLRAITGWHGG